MTAFEVIVILLLALTNFWTFLLVSMVASIGSTLKEIKK